MSKLPLYGNLAVNDFNATPKKNHGLYFNKFMGYWGNDWSLDGENKQNWIDSFVRGSLGNANELTEYLARRERFLQVHSAASQFLDTNAALIAGMGYSNPIENGMSWHHTLGVPYIPGSSLKGLVREWLESWVKDGGLASVNEGVNEENKQGFKQALHRIFGSDAKETRDKKQSDQVGSVIFHDVLPEKPVKLKAEIMTPHYQDYYEKGEAPGDWLSPTPIPFLAVDEGQRFQFAVMPRTQSESDQQDCEMVVEWLQDSLELLGIGAKTATGYGQFHCIEQNDSEMNQYHKKINQLNAEYDTAQAENTLSPNLLQVYELGTADPLYRGRKVLLLLKEINNNPQAWSTTEKEELLKKISELGQQGFGAQQRDISRQLKVLE